MKTFEIGKYKSRGLSFLLVAFLIMLYFYSSYYLAEICTSPDNCTSTERNGFWLPLQAFSLYTPIILLPFLFLSTRYFRSWALKIASWSIPLAFLFVLSESPTGGGMLAFGRELAVSISALIIANFTIVFILYSYAKNHERYKKIAGAWYFVLLGVMLFVTTRLASYFF